MANFLYHKVSEKEKTKIKKQAKQIIDNFAKAIEKIEPIKPEKSKEKGYREEKQGQEPDSEFREIMFKNAPKTKGKYIQAEKGEW